MGFFFLISNTSFSAFKQNFEYQGHNHEMLVRVANRKDPDKKGCFFKFRTLLFLITNKTLVIMATKYKIVRIANKEDPDQTASSEAA